MAVAGIAHRYGVDQRRAADGGAAERDEEVRRLVATAVAEDTVAVLDTLREELGQHDRAVRRPANPDGPT